jgi:hypothetical protein
MNRSYFIPVAYAKCHQFGRICQVISQRNVKTAITCYKGYLQYAKDGRNEIDDETVQHL